MWCSHCKTETAAADTLTAGSAVCATCGNPLHAGSSSDSTIRQARDIVAKWSSSDLLDQISALPPIPPMPRPYIAELKESAKRESAERDSQPKTTPEPEQGLSQEGQKSNLPAAVSDPPGVETKTENSTQPVKKRLEKPVVAESAATVKAEPIIWPKAEKADAVNSGPLTPADRAIPTSASLVKAEAAEAERQQEIQSKERAARAARKQTAHAADMKRKSAKANPPSQKSTRTQRTQTSTDQSVTAKDVSTSTPISVQKSEITEAKVEKSNKSDTPPKPNAKPSISETQTPNEAKSSRPRPQQSRASQQRTQRERKLSAKAEHKGSNPVSRKFRIDSPGGESADAPEEVQANVAGQKIQSNSTPGRRHRIDAGEPTEELFETANERVRTRHRPRRRYIDEPHDSVRGPHFQVTAPKRSNLTSLTGQFLAYLGVLGLTVGTAIVIYGHFGGYSDYTPTGWLVTTVAQMMLFLGVINLVSGGIEQNNDEVSTRINTLGEQLMRIEQVTEDALRGPKISPRRYDDPDALVDEHQREVVGVRERE